jgi:DNA gyrase subunit B
VVIQELHEARELKKTVARLAELGFGLPELLPEKDYDPADPRYWLTSEGTRLALTGLLELLPRVREFGREGLDIQRYKGLGEMNPDQLWKTTLDPASRSMLRVSLGNALVAEEMFSLLMGEEVSSRRRYIEAHALEISNLDV